jgi:RNA polymerase sigma-70 factor (ECF subfamily)
VPAERSEHDDQPRGVAEVAVPPFDSIYAQYCEFVRFSARYFGVKPAAMDDVVQEIFMVIHRKLGTLRQPESLRSWIYSIVRRTVTDYHRTQRTRTASDLVLSFYVETQQETQPTPLDLTEQSEAAELLKGLLDEIDPRKREVLILVEAEGMTVPEISSGLEIPLDTVYTRLRAARIAFEAALRRRIAREKSRGGW